MSERSSTLVVRHLVVGYKGAAYGDGVYFEGRKVFKATAVIRADGFISSLWLAGSNPSPRLGDVVRVNLYLRPGQVAPPDFDPLQDLVEEVSDEH